MQTLLDPGHQLGPTRAGEVLQPPPNILCFFLPSISQKPEFIKILHFLRTWANQGFYVAFVFFFRNSKLN